MLVRANDTLFKVFYRLDAFQQKRKKRAGQNSYVY